MFVLCYNLGTFQQVATSSVKHLSEPSEKQITSLRVLGTGFSKADLEQLPCVAFCRTLIHPSDPRFQILVTRQKKQ